MTVRIWLWVDLHRSRNWPWLHNVSTSDSLAKGEDYHWTEQPYKWHINDGQEVFAVLDGRVEMKYRLDGAELSTVLETGDIFYASVGTEHVAHPIGPARILVVETEGSV